MLESKAYKTYYAFTSREKTPKPKYVQKKADSDTSPKQNPVQATKGTRIKTKAKVAKSDKKKQPEKMPKVKGLDVLSKVALTGAEQLKLATKRSKTQFHSSHASNSGDGVDTLSKVLDVPIYKSESEKESWDDSEDEDEDNENDSDDINDKGDDDNDGNNGNDGDDDDVNDDDKQEGDDTNDDDEETDKEEEKIDDEERMDDDEYDEVTKELYEDVNVNLGNKDTEMADADQGASEQRNVSQESGFDSSVSSNFTSKLLNLENPSPADNEIASVLETTDRHTTAVPKITSSFTTTIPPPPLFFNALLQQATPTPTPTNYEATTSFPSLSDFSSVFGFNDRVTNLEKDLSEIKQVDRKEAQEEKNAYIELVDTSMRALIKEEVNTQLPQILPHAVSDFATPVIKKNVTESLKATVLTRYSSQPKSMYEATASLSEYELMKILLNKMEESKSHLRADYKKKLYDALVESYNTDKDIFESYDRGTKRRKSSKDAESSRDSRSKEKKSSSTSKDASQSQHKHSSKYAHAEDPSHIVDDSVVQQDQEFDTGNNDEQPADKEVTKDDWFKKPERPPTPDSDWNKRQHGKPYPFDLSKPLPLIRDHRGRQIIPQDFFINNDLEYLKGGDLSRRYSTYVTKTKAATYEIKWIKDLVHNLWSLLKVIYDKHAYWGISHWGPKRQHFYGFAANMTSSKDVYSRKRIITVTRLSIMKKYNYGHLEEIEVYREDQKLYKFREGDFPRLRLQDIEDMLLLLVQQKLTNLTINERYALNVVLRMFTRRIVIQRQVDDLQLGVDTFRSNLKNRTTYTAYSDPKGVIYKDQMNRFRLMHADELHKFSDDILDDVRSALNDIAKGIRMEYLPKRKWSGLDKRRAWVMI
ncbi:hypothetical protein Tco_0511520 [Tanacetum coccineum]